MDYDKYQQTPYTDPSVIKKLWCEHFSRNPKQRNREVTRAFEMKCSLYQFIYPDLSREEVRIRALDDIGVRSSSTSSKKNKKHFELEKQALKVSEIIYENNQERLEKSLEKLNNHKNTKKVDVDEGQAKNKISKVSKRYKKDQNTAQKPSNPKKLKPTKKPIVLEKVRIETSQTVFTKLDLNITNHNKKGHKKRVKISGNESSYSRKTRSTNIFTENVETCSNDVLVTSTTVSKKITYTKRDEKKDTGVGAITKMDKRDKSLLKKDSCIHKNIKTTTVDENEVNVENPTLKLKNTKFEGQENMSVINTAKTKVIRRGNSSKMVHKLNIWKKTKHPYDPLQNLTSLGIVKYKKMGSDEEIRNVVNTTKQEGS